MAFTKTPMTEEERKEKKRVASMKSYYAHHEENKAKMRARDPDKRRTARQEKVEADPERFRGYWRVDAARRRVQRPWLASFHACRKRAAKKGIEFTLSSDWAKSVYTGFCSITGLEFDVSKEEAGRPGPRPYSISIDRIDQTKGYVPDNCRFVLNAVNTMRGSGSDADMSKIAEALLSKS